MKRFFLSKILLAFVFSILSIYVLNAQTKKIEYIRYGDMEHWIVKQIPESYVVGGAIRSIYTIGEGDTIKNPMQPFSYDSPWAVSSAHARISGVTKASVTVFPEKRNDESGLCARLETHIEKAKVLGIINIKVLASGSIFLGRMMDPITDTDNPRAKLIDGVPFTEKPKALIYDYKVITGGDCLRLGGKGKQGKLNQKDVADVHILLQHRWEDKDGNVFATRVGTGWEQHVNSQTEWQNNHKLEIHYGDISSESFYKSYMHLRANADSAFYTRNSKGKIVEVREIGWGSADEQVTHIILQMSSSMGEPYVGSPDSKLWIDNVKLEY